MTLSKIEEYSDFLRASGKTVTTIKKYTYDVTKLLEFADGTEITDELLEKYKRSLLKDYTPASAKSMMIAANNFLEFSGSSCKIRHREISPAVPKEEERELSADEYARLLAAAGRTSDKRLRMVIETLCGAGLRFSQLKYITVEAVRKREISFVNKGGEHVIYLPSSLCAKLENYCGENYIFTGMVFTTRSGKPLDRSNISHQLRSLCKTAGIDESKLFLQNLKTLYNRTYESMSREIAEKMELVGSK